MCVCVCVHIPSPSHLTEHTVVRTCSCSGQTHGSTVGHSQKEEEEEEGAGRIYTQRVSMCVKSV